MQTAVLLLLLAPLAGFTAPIEKPSTPYHLVNAETLPTGSSPTCYRRWRHHGHLTFRLARVQSCSRRTVKQDSSADTTVHSKVLHSRRAVQWAG